MTFNGIPEPECLQTVANQRRDVIVESQLNAIMKRRRRSRQKVLLVGRRRWPLLRYVIRMWCSGRVSTIILELEDSMARTAVQAHLASALMTPSLLAIHIWTYNYYRYFSSYSPASIGPTILPKSLSFPMGPSIANIPLFIAPGNCNVRSSGQRSGPRREDEQCDRLQVPWSRGPPDTTP